MAWHQHRWAVSRAGRGRALGGCTRQMLGAGGPAWCDGAVMSAGGAAPLPSADHDGAGLIFVGEMYGVQLDQLAVMLGVTPRRAAALVARWRAAGTDRKSTRLNSSHA